MNICVSPCAHRYSWAVVGMEIFGRDGVADDDDQLRNMRTFSFALLAVFQMTVVNNWNYVM